MSSRQQFILMLAVVVLIGRFPAFGAAGRFPDDAATVIVIPAYDEVEVR